jgi:hypothetical protein
MSLLSFVAGIEHQKKTYWDFYLNDNLFFKYRVKSCTLPLPRFEIETRHTWESFYVERQIDHTFEVVMYEDIFFNTFNYFKGWMDSIYDETTKKFISYPLGVGESTIFRSATFNYYATGAVFDIPPTKSFQLSGVKIVGLSNIDNDYEDGSALVFTCTMSFEDIKVL